MTPINPFADARARMRRAEQQFKALEPAVRGWLGRSTYSLSVGTDPETRETVCQVAEIEPLPEEFSVITSELVHHFRSALDNAIHALTIAHSGSEQKGTEYPVFLDQQTFLSQGKRRISGISPACQEIVEKTQPFNNPPADANALWVLHELSNASKHQTLPVIEIFRQIQNVTLSPAGAIEVIGVKYGQPGPIKSGTEIARWLPLVVGQAKVEVNCQIAREVIFDVARPPILQSLPIIHAVKLMGDMTHAYLTALERAHNGLPVTVVTGMDPPPQQPPTGDSTTPV